MDSFEWPIKLIISFLLGAVIGLEREINEEKSIKGDGEKSHRAVLGLRSFSLTAGLGAVSGLLIYSFPIMAAIIAGATALLMLIFYSIDSKLTPDYGITTEIAVLYSFLVGFLVATNLLPIQLIVALTVVVILLLSRKENIKSFVKDIDKHEVNALVSFAILAFVILPFLPNQNYALSDFGNLEGFLKNIGLNFEKFINLELINPFKLWLIVVLITGVDLLGYILERVIGQNKGWVITSLVGGFVSSTATTISIAQESKKSKNVNPLLSGAVLANLVSFIPIAILLITLNIQLFISFFPILVSLMLAALVVAGFFLKQAQGEKTTVKEHQASSHKIFDLVSALKFMGIYLLINIVSKIALVLFGTGGFFATTALGSLTGIDAVVINTAQLVGNNIDIAVGVWALLLANAINLIAKSVYSFIQGSKEFAVKFLVSMIFIIGVSVITAFLAVKVF